MRVSRRLRRVVAGTSPRHSRLSVVCVTNHPGPLVAACLEGLDEIADHVVVAADDRAADDDLAWYGSVADSLLLYPFTGANQFRPWVGSRIEGTWLLLLDGDELVEEGLLAVIDDLLAVRDVAGYLLPAKWSYPDARSYLISEPWRNDVHLRIVRNDDRIWFPGRKHTGARTSGPVERLDVGYYHLDLLVTQTEQRRSKVRRYELETGGKLTFTGFPINQAFYLPEDRGDLEFVPTPETDRRRIQRAISPRRRPSRWRVPQAAERAAVEDIISNLDDRPLDDAAYRGCVTPERLQSIPARARVRLGVRVANLSPGPWPAGSERRPQIHLAYHWYGKNGTPVVWDGERTVIPRTVRPGAVVPVEMTVVAPDDPGQYQLGIDLVHEERRWLGLEHRQPVDVEESLAAALCRTADSSGRVRVGEAWRVRRRVAEIDALSGVAIGAECITSEDPGHLAMVAGLPIGGWGLDEPTLRFLAIQMLQARPEAVLEFGSGTSTAMLAFLLTKLHGAEDVRLVSIDQDPVFAARTTAELAARGLAGVARVVTSPVVSPDGELLLAPGYDPAPVLEAAEGLPIGLVLVDGPSRASGASRLSTIPTAQKVIEAEASFYLDDALRDHELWVASEWERLPGVDLLGIHLTPKGLLEGRVRPVRDHTPGRTG